MNPFDYQRAIDAGAAVHAISADAKFLAGGTNLIDLMKQGVERPRKLIDITRVALASIEPLPDGGIRIGALARNSDTANHPLVRQRYPLLSQAILAGASPQLRNLATNGGNLMQRTRCPYFMNTEFPRCNKRAPGSGCDALDGWQRVHAIFGASEHCIAVHPSDMCVALAALDAVIRVQSSRGVRNIAMADFHRLPGDTPQLDTNLKPDELITAIDLPPSPYGAHVHYVKIRDRASYEFALVSAAAALDLDGGAIRGARIVLGGVAHKPWRAERAEQTLAGKRPSPELFESAGRAAVEGARPYPGNAFKVQLAGRAVVRALHAAGGIA